MAGDDTDDIMEKISEFNERHPQDGVKITGDSRSRSLNARRDIAKSRRESGVSAQKRDKPFMGGTAYSE
jgi:hypothetical protein